MKHSTLIFETKSERKPSKPIIDKPLKPLQDFEEGKVIIKSHLS